MSWNDCTLGDVAVFNYGKALPERVRVPGEFPVYGSGGCVGTHVSAIISGPGIVVGRKGTVGATYWVDGDFCPIDTTYYVTPKSSETNIRFLYYLIESLPLSEMNTDAAVPGLNRDNALRVKIRFPDPNIQSQVAELLAGYDDLIENNRQRIVLLEEAARLLYREWFVHFRFPGHEHVKIIDGVPDGWEQLTFVDVCETIGGGTPSTRVPEYWNDADVTWITPTDITRNNCLTLLDGEKKISQAGLKKSSARLVPPYTILMTSRASVGFFGIIDREVCTNQGFINIIPNEENYRYYLLFNLIHRVEEIRSHAGGSTYAEISKSKFRALPVAVPTNELLKDFDEGVRSILNQVRALKKQSDALAQARDLLLPRLMDGRLEI